jgi:hypothetical protein
MSSKPYPEGVTEVVKLLDEVEALNAEEEVLRPMVERFKEVQTRIETLRRQLPELLRSMDLEATEHFGWEGRMSWFLAEMRRQIIARENCEGCAKAARHPGEGNVCILHGPTLKANTQCKVTP